MKSNFNDEFFTLVDLLIIEKVIRDNCTVNGALSFDIKDYKEDEYFKLQPRIGNTISFSLRRKDINGVLCSFNLETKNELFIIPMQLVPDEDLALKDAAVLRARIVSVDELEFKMIESKKVEFPHANLN